ncbi:unnamed protein product [Laminaria digitata]
MLHYFYESAALMWFVLLAVRSMYQVCLFTFFSCGEMVASLCFLPDLVLLVCFLLLSSLFLFYTEKRESSATNERNILYRVGGVVVDVSFGVLVAGSTLSVVEHNIINKRFPFGIVVDLEPRGCGKLKRRSTAGVRAFLVPVTRSHRARTMSIKSS